MSRTVIWALREGHKARRGIRKQGMSPPPRISPPPYPDLGYRAVELALKLTRRTCLERALIIQAWYAAAGYEREILIGVKGPSRDFEAHAWLEGEHASDYQELARYTWSGSGATLCRDETPARITVVIAAWDKPYARLVNEAIESVLSQNRPAKILVIDNASQSPLSVPEGVQVLQTDSRLSRGEARNFGLEHVETEYVLFLDADDLLLPGALARSESQLDAEPDRAACAMSILEGSIYTDLPGSPHSVPKAIVTRLSRFKRLFCLGCVLWPLYSTQGATLIRTRAISANAYADADGGEDWALAISLALRGVTVLPDPGLVYRSHSSAGGWADTRSTGYLPQGAAEARHRLRSDTATPRWLRAVLPAIYVTHVILLRVAWPLRARLRLHTRSVVIRNVKR